MKPKYVKLSKPYSQAILKDQCPFCEYFMECDRYVTETKNHVYQLCKLRSTDCRKVWIEISPRAGRRRVELGDRYGKLVVYDHGGYDHHGNLLWTCRCDCGKYVTVRGDNLLRGKVKSCGCLRSSGMPTVIYGEEEESSYRPRYTRGATRNPDGSKHKYPPEHSSKIGCAVDVPVKLYDKDDPYDPDKNGLKYIRLTCDECGGVVRYNRHDLMECERCGLIYGGELPERIRRRVKKA